MKLLVFIALRWNLNAAMVKPNGRRTENPSMSFVNIGALNSAKGVGYLTRGDNYPSGEVSETVFERLISLVKRPFVVWGGYHYCDLDPCGSEQLPTELRYKDLLIPSRCDSDILVPDKAALYVAPALILHYIRFHHYLPPSYFLDAVLACPEPGSPEYLAAIEKISPAGNPW